jgi:hypothetical protein
VELLIFGGVMLPCFFIFLIFLHWDFCIWGQVLGCFISPVFLKHSQCSNRTLQCSFSPLYWWIA